jgi:hypothetical protein
LIVFLFIWLADEDASMLASVAGKLGYYEFITLFFLWLP